MLSTIPLVLAGLSTGQKIGLGAVGVTFIVFALVSSLLLPRRSANFPGRGMGWYVALCFLFFLAMISAVLVFGKEKEEQAGNESPAHTSTVSGSLPGQTTSGPTSTTAGTTTAPPTTTGGGGGGSLETKGSPTAGKQVFASAGCGGCHTLKAAGSSGNVGPNLDTLKPSEDDARDQVEHGGGGMPPFEGQLSDKQIQDVAAFVFASSHS
jgi:cytochrome c553